MRVEKKQYEQVVDTPWTPAPNAKYLIDGRGEGRGETCTIILPDPVVAGSTPSAISIFFWSSGGFGPLSVLTINDDRFGAVIIGPTVKVAPTARLATTVPNIWAFIASVYPEEAPISGFANVMHYHPTTGDFLFVSPAHRRDYYERYNERQQEAIMDCVRDVISGMYV
jgi:hypothetical protein